MSTPNTGNAVRFYVFVDNFNFTSERPITVIINKYKLISDLRREFAEKKFYLAEEQHWVINKTYCYNEFPISNIVENMVPFKKGFVAFLFIMSVEEKDALTEYFGSFVERRYCKIRIEDRWNEPEKVPMIIADVIDITKPRPQIGWNCGSCTLFNKPFIRFCDVCGNCRPESFQIPNDYYYTKEDRARMKRDKEIEEQAKKLEEESIKRLEIEKKENLENLKKMYKSNLAFTTEPTECPLCAEEFPAGEAIILRSCLHIICKECFKGYVTNLDDPQMKCYDTNCMGRIEDQEIQAVLTDVEFQNYQKLSLRTAEATTDHTFHCKTPNCEAWVVYDDNVNFFPCPICNAENCMTCQAIHKDQTCKEYQEELAIKARNDVAAQKDLEFLQNLINTGQAMNCPGCKIIVQKKSGCDWMQCNMCKTEICWATKGPRWGPKGKGDTSGGCKCRVQGKCHPNCGNCH